MTKEMGKVWLVGAGPGDVGLLTCKGREVLAGADVVVYDSLVGAGVLAQVPEGARLIDVGKRAANHTMPQEQINQVLLSEALAGNRVVRLKGGDPFLFGRGGEELELLAQEGVPFEVVPGVTSALSVPAYNGIPVTHRDFTSSVCIVTGHKRAGADYDIDFEALVRTKATLVFLMGVKALPDIVAGLLVAGMPASTTAAVLQEGTTAGQRRVVSTLDSLEEDAKRAGIAAPAIIVVGEVCSLADEFFWYERLPLQGCKVLVTRPRELISTMAQALREKGAEVLEVPSIATEAIVPCPELEQAFDDIDSYDWLVLTSPSGVDIFFDALVRSGLDVRSLSGLKIAVLGSGTGKALRAHGIVADFVPSKADGATLGAELAQAVESGSRILIARARIGNPELVEALSAFAVDDVATYETVSLPSGPVKLDVEFENGRIFCVAFTSSSGVRAFAAANPELDYSIVRAACIGEQTRKTAEGFGMPTWMADTASIDSLIALIECMYDQSKGE